MTRRPWPYLFFVVGVVLAVLASNRMAGFFVPLLAQVFEPREVAAIVNPRAFWHVVGVVIGIALVGTGVVLWVVSRQNAPPPPLPAQTPQSGVTPSQPRFGQTPSKSRALPAPPRFGQTPSKSRPLPVHTPSAVRPVPSPPRFGQTPSSARRAPAAPMSGGLPLSNDPETAEATGEYERAGELYDRQQDNAAAARAYAKAAREAAAGSPERTSLLNRCMNRARKAGNNQIAIELLADIGEMNQAIELARSTGDAKSTAALMQRSGDHAGAAGVLAAAGDAAGAAQIMMAAGNTRGAIEFLAVEDPAAGARLAIDEGDFDRAVELYMKAGQPGEAAAILFEEEPKRAGELYAQAGDFISAAGAFEHAGAKTEAAQAWLKAGKTDRAAPLLEALGDDAGLVKCRELEGDYLGATRLLLRLGRPEEAQKMLGRLPVEALQTPGPSVVAADCLMQTGHVDEAIPLLHGILQNERLDEALQCESCYLLGMAYLGKQQKAQAESLLQQVVLLDPKYRDARRLLARIGKKTLPPDAPE